MVQCTRAPRAALTLHMGLLGGAGDGAISEEDMEIVLRQLAGSSLSDAELKGIIRKVGGEGGRLVGRWVCERGQACRGRMRGAYKSPCCNAAVCLAGVCLGGAAGSGGTSTAVCAPPAGGPRPSPHPIASPPHRTAQVMKNAAASERGLTFAEYRAALEGQEIHLHLDVPVDD